MASGRSTLELGVISGYVGALHSLRRVVMRVRRSRNEVDSGGFGVPLDMSCSSPE
jgi:hypothetical protein